MNLSDSANDELIEIGRFESPSFARALVDEIDASGEDPSRRGWRTLRFQADGAVTSWRLPSPFHRYVVVIEADGTVAAILRDRFVSGGPLPQP